MWGCGQRGPLYLPSDPAAAQRATLPEALNPTTEKPALPAEMDAAPATDGPLGR